MTPNEITAEMNALNEALKPKLDGLFYLLDRWSDEKEYEDFADYGDAMKTKHVPDGYTFISAHERPFGLTIENIASKNQYRFSITKTGKCTITKIKPKAK